MEEPMNPVAIEAAIRESANQIAKSVDTVTDTLTEARRQSREYDLAFARAWMSYEGPRANAKYAAEIATASKREEFDIADIAHRHAERRTRASENELRALQSIGASVRTMYPAFTRDGS